MNHTIQRALAWTGPVMILGWVGAFVFLAGFIPPPDPALAPDAVVDMYATDTDLIRLGLVISTFASMFLLTFSAAIYGQIKRVEGERAPLAMVFICSAALLTLEFILPMAIWQAATYRLDGVDPLAVQSMNDMGWIMFMLISGATFQFGSLGLAILADRRPNPVYPRWAGYFNFWVATLTTPAGFVVFFKEPPFAWNGLIGFFLPLASFAAWIAVMTFLTLRAVDEEEAAAGRVDRHEAVAA